jgi:aminotransferase class I and II
VGAGSGGGGGGAAPEHAGGVGELPNNPTGAVPDEGTWRALAGLCEERGIWLFSDEVYRGLELPPRSPLPQAADLSSAALSLNVMSKAYGLPGLRIGWIACRDHQVLCRLERAKHYTSICNSAPSEVLALIALRARETILTRNRQIVARNLSAFGTFFARFPDPFEWAPPDGGCVAFPRYLGGRRCRGDVHRLGRAGRRAAAAGQHLRLATDRHARRPVPHRRGPPRPAAGTGRVGRLAGQAPMSLPVVGLEQIREVAKPSLIFAAVRDALIAHAEGRTQLPSPAHLEFPGAPGDCHVKAGHIAGSPRFAVKIATGFYANPRISAPVNNGLMLVLSATTGAPWRCWPTRGG